MPTHVVIRLHRPRPIPQNDRALPESELEQEEVPRVGDPAFMIGHQPEMLGDEPLIVQVVLLCDVILPWNRGPLLPAPRIGRRLRGHGQQLGAAAHREAPVCDFGRQAGHSAARHRGPFRRRGGRPDGRLLAEERTGQRHRRRAGRHGGSGKITPAQSLTPAHALLLRAFGHWERAPWPHQHRKFD